MSQPGIVMSQNRSNRIWSGLLILLPSLAIAGVGGYLLWKDWQLADQQAQKRARETSRHLLSRMRTTLFGAIPALPQGLDRVKTGQANADEAPLRRLRKRHPGSLACLLTTNRTLQYPPSVDSYPLPEPIDWSIIDSKAQAAWDRGYNGPSQPVSPLKTANRLRRLIERPKTPDRLRALAHYRLGLLSKRQEQWTEAWQYWQAAVSNWPEVVTEAGLSLKALARLNMLRIFQRLPAKARPPRDWLETVISEAVLEPSFLSDQIVAAVVGVARQITPEDKASLLSWERLWTLHQQARRAYAGWLQHRTSPLAADSPHNTTGQWIGLTEKNIYLAVPQRGELPGWIIFYRADQLKRQLEGLVNRTALPPFLGIQVKVAGRELLSTHGNARPLASVSSESEVEGSPDIALTVALTDPSRFYAQQRQRTFWFGGLLAAGMIAVGFGYWSSQTALRKQEELNTLKTNFLSSVSHELRTPISSIQLMAEELLATETQRPEQSRQYHRYIVQDCLRLSRMIENVLDYSRHEQGRKHFDRQPVDLVALVESGVERMKPLASDRQVELLCSVEGTPPEVVEVDSAAMQQILANLVDNAVAHSPEGSQVQVLLEFCRSTFRLRVRDQGPGIPENEREKVFHRFYRIGSELRRESSGIGLGLSIVQEAVMAHDGEIRIESSEQGGTEFAVEIPYQNAT